MKASDLHSLHSQDKVRLIDVRSPLEFRQNHIVGSRNVPLEDVLSGGESFDFSEDRQLCIICQSGKRAERARTFLAEHKGVSADVLDGGVQSWCDCGLPVEKDSRVHGVSLFRQVQMIIGGMNLIGFALAWLVSPYWLVLPALTSLGLLIAGLTGFCGLAVVLAKMPWNRV